MSLRRGTFRRPLLHSFPAGTLSWLALLLNARKLLTAEAASAYIIFSIFRTVRWPEQKHIAKAQTASIRCVENLLSVKLFAQGQRQGRQGTPSSLPSQMAKRENTQKAQNNCGKTQRNQEGQRERERNGGRQAATQKQLAKTRLPSAIPLRSCRPNVLENFFLLHGYNNVGEKRFFLLLRAKKSAPASRSMLHFSLMAVASLLCQKN